MRRSTGLTDALIIYYVTLKDWCRNNSMWVWSPRESAQVISPGQTYTSLIGLKCHLFCKEGAWVECSLCLYLCICFDRECSLLKSSWNLFCGNKVSRNLSRKTYTILLFSWVCWNISKTRRIPFRVVSAPMMCFNSSGIISSNLVFPATLVLILIALSLRGTVSAKMPLGQKASL